MIERLAIADVWLYTPRRFEDERGWFAETFSSRALAEVLGGVSFVQDNHSLSRNPGTMRGMHFQIPPKAQDKLVRVVRGAVFDVAVDIRRDSPTYGKWVGATLSAENGAQIFVPKGFAHGFLTLEPDTEVIYKVSDDYSGAHERGLVWSDPNLAIEWPFSDAEVTIKDRDREFPRLSALDHYF